MPSASHLTDYCSGESISLEIGHDRVKERNIVMTQIANMNKSRPPLSRRIVKVLGFLLALLSMLISMMPVTGLKPYLEAGQ